MEIKVKSLKFDAGERLIAFVEKKVSRLSKFFDGVAQEAEVVLEDTKEEEGQNPDPGAGGQSHHRPCRRYL